MTKLLLLEDDPAVREPLASYLRQEGFDVTEVTTLAQARTEMAKSYQIAVFDWTLPDGAGVDLIRERRALGDTTPCLLLTARTELVDKVMGLEMGANDYVLKPFEPRELLARIRAHLRATSTSKAPTADSEILMHSGIEMNLTTREVRWKSQLVDLKKLEFDLLKILIENPGKVFTRDELLNRVWGYEHFPTTRTVDNHIVQLRQKIDESLFETLRGVGYRLKKV